MTAVSLSNFTVYRKQRPSFAAAISCTDFRSHPKVVGCWNRISYYPVRLSKQYRGRRICSYDGLWEEPDDGSDDSEYEDDSDEEIEDNDLDYESDWESNSNPSAAVNDNAEALAARKYEEDLVEEVTQLLSPEERAILEQNEVPDFKKLSTAKWKPFHTFALAGHIKYMDGMLEKDYDIELVDKGGLTALHQAVIGKREAVISHLLRKRANLNAKDKDGVTPLHYAAQVGAMQTVKLLIKYKADLNVADNEGWTPLHVAMQTRNRDIVKILLVNGADKTLRNKDGNTPLDLAFCYGKDFKSYDLAKLVKQVPATTRY